MVKVLARRPQAETLRDRGVAWLRDRYRDLPDIPFGYEPERERHAIELRYRLDGLAPSVRLSLSPAYRARWTMDVAPTEWAVWSEHDVFASYLTRWWFGVGVGAGHRSRAGDGSPFSARGLDRGADRLAGGAWRRTADGTPAG